MQKTHQLTPRRTVTASSTWFVGRRPHNLGDAKRCVDISSTNEPEVLGTKQSYAHKPQSREQAVDSSQSSGNSTTGLEKHTVPIAPESTYAHTVNIHKTRQRHQTIHTTTQRIQQLKNVKKLVLNFRTLLFTSIGVHYSRQHLSRQQSMVHLDMSNLSSQLQRS
jgi:hypothetical protein